MVLLPGNTPGAAREYLDSSDVLPSLEAGIEEMLRACADTKTNPINFLTQSAGPATETIALDLDVDDGGKVSLSIS